MSALRAAAFLALILSASAQKLTLTTISSRPDMISGGDTLVCRTSGGNPESGGYAGEIFINYDRCTNCRICEDHCPVNCITFERVRFVDDTMRILEKPELRLNIPVLATA